MDRRLSYSDGMRRPMDVLFQQLHLSRPSWSSELEADEETAVSEDLWRLPVDPRIPDFVIYRSLSRFVMPLTEMARYGYPLPDPESREPGRAIVPRGIYPTTPNFFNSNQRTCSRCKEVFQVKEDGTPVVWKRCFYHKGVLKRHPRSGVLSYSCCFRPMASLGCRLSDSHVVDGSGHPDYERNFRSTIKRPPGRRDTLSPGVYALDCEMVREKDACFFLV